MTPRRKKAMVMPLDSLLDTVSNLVGVLIFMVVMAVLCAREIKVTLNSVLRAPRATHPTYCVCRSGTITLLDPGAMLKELGDVKTELETSGKRPTLQALVWEANRRRIGSTSSLCIQFVREQGRGHSSQDAGLGIRCYAQGAQTGETAADLANLDGNFAQVLRKAKDTSLVYFYVYPDGIDVFDTARKLAQVGKLEVGWRPMLPDQTIGFSGSARELSISHQ